MKKLNIEQMIRSLLEDALGCVVEMRNGIVHVTAPDGSEWTFTIPMERGKELQTFKQHPEWS